MCALPFPRFALGISPTDILNSAWDCPCWTAWAGVSFQNAPYGRAPAAGNDEHLDKQIGGYRAFRGGRAVTFCDEPDSGQLFTCLADAGPAVLCSRHAEHDSVAMNPTLGWWFGSASFDRSVSIRSDAQPS